MNKLKGRNYSENLLRLLQNRAVRLQRDICEIMKREIKRIKLSLRISITILRREIDCKQLIRHFYSTEYLSLLLQ